MGEKNVRHGRRRYNAYRCRCTRCRTAESRYDTNRTRLIAYGRWAAYSDAEPVLAHVQALMARGLTPTAISDLAGVNPDCVTRVLAGNHIRGPLTINAQCILAVTFDLDALPDRTHVDAAGTRRRVQALMALGYSMSVQAAHLGKTVSNFYKVLRNPKVFASTARAVRDLYNALSMTPAPLSHGAKLARSMAARNGWPTPVAWDDDLIDLPDDVLQAELTRRVNLMDPRELRRCNDAHYRLGDLSPLVVAASREYERRRTRKRAAA